MPLQLESDKKILLLGCKRHTTCRIASTTSVVLTRGGGKGTPSQVQVQMGGTPSLARGVPHPRSEQGDTPSLGGTPSLAGVPPCPDLGWGTPPSGPGWGTPLSGPGQGTPSPFRPGQGAPHLDLARIPPIWIWPRYPPPPPVDRRMDRHVSKHYLPVVLRTRAVTSLKQRST